MPTYARITGCYPTRYDRRNLSPRSLRKPLQARQIFLHLLTLAEIIDGMVGFRPVWSMRTFYSADGAAGMDPAVLTSALN
jgi:hypothetical protein